MPKDTRVLPGPSNALDVRLTPEIQETSRQSQKSKASSSTSRNRKKNSINSKGYTLLRDFYVKVYLKNGNMYCQEELDVLCNDMWDSGNFTFTEANLQRYLRGKSKRNQPGSTRSCKGEQIVPISVIPDDTQKRKPETEAPEVTKTPPIRDGELPQTEKDVQVPAAEPDSDTNNLTDAERTEDDRIWEEFIDGIILEKTSEVQVLPVDGLVASETPATVQSPPPPETTETNSNCHWDVTTLAGGGGGESQLESSSSNFIVDWVHQTHEATSIGITQPENEKVIDDATAATLPTMYKEILRMIKQEETYVDGLLALAVQVSKAIEVVMGIVAPDCESGETACASTSPGPYNLPT